jgi:hypothetical protein
MRSLFLPRPTLLAVIALVVMACSGSTGGSPSDDASPSLGGTGSDGPVPSGSPGASGSPVEGDPAIVDPVLADAAVRANVAPDAVVLESLTAVTWSDGALGCPEPGMLYTQAEVPGWQAIVVAGSVRLDYRIRGPGRFIVCDQPSG